MGGRRGQGHNLGSLKLAKLGKREAMSKTWKTRSREQNLGGEKRGARQEAGSKTWDARSWEQHLENEKIGAKLGKRKAGSKTWKRGAGRKTWKRGTGNKTLEARSWDQNSEKLPKQESKQCSEGRSEDERRKTIDPLQWVWS